MNDDAIATLVAANPVPELPAVEPVERLYALGVRAAAPDRRSRARKVRHGRAAALVAVLAVAAATTVGLAVTGGSTSLPGVNIAAAAYAATSPGPSIVEVVFVQRFASGNVPPLTIREWLQTSTGRRRVRNELPGSGHFAEVETAIAPGAVENWDSADRSGNVIHREILQRSAPVQTPAEGIEQFRRLFKEDALRVVGHERRAGRLLWKLEGIIGSAKYSANAPLVPTTATVVLVDPKTYLPVLQRQINLTVPGRRVEGEKLLVGFRRLPVDHQSESLLSLRSQHPNARVLTRTLTASQR